MLNMAHYQRNATQNYSEAPPHTSQNGRHEEVHKQEMLERVWREGNSPRLLLEMYTGAATMENSMEGLSKTTDRVAIRSNNPTPGHTAREASNSKDTRTPVFTAALSTLAQTWEQPAAHLQMSE